MNLGISIFKGQDHLRERNVMVRPLQILEPESSAQLVEYFTKNAKGLGSNLVWFVIISTILLQFYNSYSELGVGGSLGPKKRLKRAINVRGIFIFTDTTIIRYDMHVVYVYFDMYKLSQ